MHSFPFQVEGVIAERNLSLGHLIGVFTEFFKRMGNFSGKINQNPVIFFFRNRKPPLQADLQSIHRAVHGDLRVSQRAQEMGRGNSH